MLEKISVNQINDNTCIKVYNPEKKELIAVFENYKKAGAKLGINTSTVYHVCARKGRTYAPIIDMTVALRLSAIKEGDLESIEHCRKKTLLIK